MDNQQYNTPNDRVEILYNGSVFWQQVSQKNRFVIHKVKTIYMYMYM